MSQYIIRSHMIRVDSLTTMRLIRVPFYHVFKTTFLLYLPLPQTRGASYVYSVHLHPLTAKHEVEIDASLGTIKERIWRWMMILASVRVRPWRVVRGCEIIKRPPEPADPAGPAQLAYKLWQIYGPALPALLHAPYKPPSTPSSPSHLHPQSLRFTSSNHRMQPPYPYAQPSSQPQPHDSRARGPTSAIDMHPDAVLLAQRRALEAELSGSRTRIHMAKRINSQGREIGSVDEGEGAGDDRGGSWSS
ncbi:hypothetical protein JB92DRAFT_3061607 [Gautieria morchelliformis]|nr:hypothetical protein JB92DRAFT_3061607 [Gautieria morchelliformis]